MEMGVRLDFSGCNLLGQYSGCNPLGQYSGCNLLGQYSTVVVSLVGVSIV